jgi:hypothetical protein
MARLAGRIQEQRRKREYSGQNVTGEQPLARFFTAWADGKNDLIAT